MELNAAEIELLKEFIRIIESFISEVESLLDRKKHDRMEVWLDNNDVCRILGISKRSLQHYRDSGMLPFSQINNKIYYKPQVISQVLELLTQNK